MRAIVLDGSHGNDPTGERVLASLLTALRARGWDAEHVILRDRKIGNCAGDFFCWIRTPGVCNVNDDNRAIAAAIVASDLLVYLTPVTFGGYSSALKRMVDHQIQNISPFFATVEGETHHQKRYPKSPDLLALGWLDAPDPQAEAVFRHLVQRNALNLHAEKSASGVVTAGQSDEEIATSMQRWLDALSDGPRSGAVELPVRVEPGPEGSEIRRSLLLVGSPRTRKSTSYSLGSYLSEQLGVRAIHTDTIFVYTSHSPAGMEALLDAAEHADLVTLAFPLYVDSLSAPVIEVLERIAARRRARPTRRRQLFAALTNCGFPEAHQTATAIAVCETFAKQAGFTWAGSLALGGGQGIVNGVPLAELGGRASSIRKSLEMAADSLAQGRAIPAAAQALMSRPAIPGWLYRLLGGYGWKRWAGRYGAARMLKRQPYRPESR